MVNTLIQVVGILIAVALIVVVAVMVNFWPFRKKETEPETSGDSVLNEPLPFVYPASFSDPTNGTILTDPVSVRVMHDQLGPIAFKVNRRSARQLVGDSSITFCLEIEKLYLIRGAGHYGEFEGFDPVDDVFLFQLFTGSDERVHVMNELLDPTWKYPGDEDEHLAVEFHDPIDGSLLTDPVPVAVQHLQLGMVDVMMNRSNAQRLKRGRIMIFQPQPGKRYLIRSARHRGVYYDGFEFMDDIFFYQLFSGTDDMPEEFPVYVHGSWEYPEDKKQEALEEFLEETDRFIETEESSFKKRSAEIEALREENFRGETAEVAVQPEDRPVTWHSVLEQGRKAPADNPDAVEINTGAGNAVRNTEQTAAPVSEAAETQKVPAAMVEPPSTTIEVKPTVETASPVDAIETKAVSAETPTFEVAAIATYESPGGSNWE